MPESQGKHLTFNDRCDIAAMLSERCSIRAIARRIRVHPSTVSREIQRNRVFVPYAGPACNNHNLCVSRRTCEILSLCGDRRCNKRCARCKIIRCNERCGDFVEMVCRHVARAPFCCNGCDTNKSRCSFKRYVYRPKEAQVASDARLKETRAGVNATPAQVEKMVRIVKRQSKKGQSLAHIWTTHADAMYCSERTFYRHQAAGLFEMTALEFPRKARYKQRKAAGERLREQADFTSRTYEDYLKLSDIERASVVQIDTVEGRRADRQAILTLHFVRLHFQIFILMAEKTQEEVKAALDWIETLCGASFSDLFGLMLTDRGVEMIDYEGIERSVTGDRRCRVYYCDPQQSAQKGACEKNHVELRRILPKRRSDFDALTPFKVALISSHVNSYTRASLGGKSPYALASQVLPARLLEELGIEPVDADDVNLTPSLLDLTV